MKNFACSVPAAGLLLSLVANVGCAATGAGTPPRTAPSKAAESAVPDPIASKIAGFDRRSGLLDLALDRKGGKVWLVLPPAAGPRNLIGTYLFAEGLVSGLGSNPVGLDRGQMGDVHVLEIRRLGGRVLFEIPNQSFRAVSDSEPERRSVAESFASSVLWGGAIEAEGADGRLLVDLTPFVVRDSHGVARALAGAGQGSWSLDGGRSAVDPDACLALPENVELTALLTFQSDAPGGLVRGVAPKAQSVTLVARQSLLKLPDDGYRTRRFDPRMGHFTVGFLDFASPLAAPIEARFAARHRLRKLDPAAPRSRVEKPLVYYVDAAAPEPVRSALIEGASWWREAFDRAGFIDAFRVEVLPDGVDPLDARYNVIEWVHRSTRGWSYGGGIIDPRTGEMLNGHVLLGSQRVRHDRLLFEGLVGAAATGQGGAADPNEVALARIRQLAAHEVGHSLGLAHNFAASTRGRASVMDYPAPLVRVTPEGELDLSDAYAKGIGTWDVFAIRYLYSEFPPGADEAAELERIVRESLAAGQIYLTDQDARPPGASDPRANLWDNGPEPVAALENALAVRRIALSRFGERNLGAGRPTALLDEVLAPLYFHHRYQLDAAVKAVGGVEYAYAIPGDGQVAVGPVPPGEQRRALAAVLATVAPAELDLPESVLRLLPPRPAEVSPSVDTVAGATEPAFDALGVAATAADMTFGALLRPERAARLIDLHRRDPAAPDLDEVIAAILRQAATRDPDPRRAEIGRTVESAAVRALLGLAGAARSTAAVRARTEAALDRLRDRTVPAGDAAERGHRQGLAREIERFFARAATTPPPPVAVPDLPPGQPIGQPDSPSSALPGTLGACSLGG